MGKRNPNGYGCVTKLKGKRSKPWVIKVTVYDEEGHGREFLLKLFTIRQRRCIQTMDLETYFPAEWDME